MNSTSNITIPKTLNFVSLGEALAQDNGKSAHSKTVNISFYSFLQAIVEIFVGLIEKNNISRIFVVNSTEELIGASALSLDSILRAMHSGIKLSIDKIMAFVQASIGVVLFFELVSKFSSKKSLIMHLPFADGIGAKGKNMLKQFSNKFSLQESHVMNFLKGALGLSSLALALSKNNLSQSIQDPQQKDAFRRSMWIDFVCACEAMLLFIPEEKTLATLLPKLFGGFTESSGALGKVFGKWSFASLVEKIYLAISCLKLTADSVPFLLGDKDKNKIN